MTLIELATGKHPFLASTVSATTIAITQRQVEYQAPAVPGGKQFAALIRAMLAKDAARRPAMAEVANRLESIAALSARGRRNLLWIAAACAVVAPAAFLWFRNAEQRAPQFRAPVAITRLQRH